MKKFFILIAFTTCWIDAFEQIPFYDARILKDSLPTDTTANGKVVFETSTKIQILLFNTTFKNYFSDSINGIENDSARFEIIRRQLSRNPFIAIAPIQESGAFNILNDVSKSFSSGSIFSSGIPNATVIADGIGKFLAKRTKEELTVLFFDRFREFLDTHPEIAQLFPSTTILINSVLNQEYSNLLSTLRAAFDSDLKSLLRNIATIADLDTASSCRNCIDRKKGDCETRLNTIKTFFSTNEGRALVAGLLIADGVIGKQNPADILTAIVGNNTIRGSNSDLYNALVLLNIFSQSLRSEDLSETWVPAADLNTLVNDQVAFKIYLGLIYEQVKNAGVKIGTKDIATEYITLAHEASLRSYVTNLLSEGKKLETSFKKLKDKEEDSTGARLIQASQFVASVHSFFDVAIQYRTIDPGIPAVGNTAKKIFLYVDTSLSIVQKILVKEYYGAVLSATVLLENLLKTREDFKSNGDFMPAALTNQSTALAKKQFLRSVLRYGNFAANVVAAKNSDDVSKAIETIALPPGSASIKRTTNFNIAFQAYTGIVSGNIQGEEGFWNSVSVYAPVGIGFSVGLRPGSFLKRSAKQNPEDKRTWGSLSLFGSIIDVGAVVSYRFYHPDEKLSDSVAIAWSNIFAPGINLVYGIPKWPISIGFGGQYQATLRKFNASTATVVERSGFRWNLFIALDLPLLNLYTSKK